MNTLPCGHPGRIGTPRTCLHLAVEEPPPSTRHLTGVGTRYDLVCAECTPAALVDVCESCADRADQKSFPSRWHGEPEVLLRDRELGGTWSTRPCPVRPLNDGCLAPMPGHWLALTAEGFVRITGDDQWLVGPVELPEENPVDEYGFPDRPRRGLHTSRDGRFAAVVSDYGQFATVVDLDEWATVLDLDRERNDNEFTRYPLAFLGQGETAKVVAATDWNRLDVFTLPGAELLTDRQTAAPQKGEPEPEHYLDYFQGALHVSPSERWLVTDGWVWHPIGAPEAVDLAAWLGGDRHAAEHARSLTPGREHAWDQPMAWVDDRTVAIQRMGVADDRMLDGVELYDATTGRRTGMFAGPKGPMWAHGGLLYVAAEAGLEVWDPAGGARVGFLEGFTPIAHHDGTFAELRNDQLRTWTTAR
ncbi:MULTISPECIES: hypothetical protein [unclassified Amycolatopsis]|uniref:hypothetical protein n=1 Tax=unclassified Amycolatopsis TaxID=2618356 RepID=UPI00287BB7CE|nr:MULTISPECIES: hypothetical protein [unclassified Amycolatopsis]